MIYIGIDPGVNNGIALWDSGNKTLLIETKDFWKLINTMDLISQRVSRFTVILEDPNQNKPTFNRGKNKPVNERISQNVGSNKRTAQLIKEYCEINNIPIELVRPSSAKWDKQTFENITKYKGSTSQHGRDAAKLVFGR